jgi:hypothetical protein
LRAVSTPIAKILGLSAPSWSSPFGISKQKKALPLLHLTNSPRERAASSIRGQVRSVELREEMKRAFHEIVKNPPRVRAAEGEGIAPLRPAEREAGWRRAGDPKRTKKGKSEPHRSHP